MNGIKKMALLKYVIGETFWMARRYAHGRHTYAPSMVRGAYKILEKNFPELVPHYDIMITPPAKKFHGLREDYLDDINEKT